MPRNVFHKAINAFEFGHFRRENRTHPSLVAARCASMASLVTFTA